MKILNGMMIVIWTIFKRNVYSRAQKPQFDLSNASFSMLSADSDVGYRFEMMSWMLLDHKMIRFYWQW